GGVGRCLCHGYRAGHSGLVPSLRVSGRIHLKIAISCNQWCTPWLLRPIAIFTRMYPQFPGRGESCIRPALVPQGRSQGSPLYYLGFQIDKPGTESKLSSFVTRWESPSFSMTAIVTASF